MESALFDDLYRLFCFIRYDLLIGFGVYSIAFSLLGVFGVRDSRLKAFDVSAWRVAMVLGIGVGVIQLLKILSLYYLSANYLVVRTYWKNLMGPSSIFFWMELVIPIFLSCLLIVNKLKESLVYRLLLVLLCVLIEQLVIIITSFHRDFLPSSWAPLGMPSWTDVAFGLPVKMLMFLLVAGIYYFWRRRREQAVGA